MTVDQLINALIINGFSVDSMPSAENFIITHKGIEVYGIHDGEEKVYKGFDDLNDMKRGQLCHLINKYLGLKQYEAVSNFD